MPGLNKKSTVDSDLEQGYMPSVVPGSLVQNEPIVAHVAPDEEEVAARISEQVTKKLQQQVELKVQEVQRQQWNATTTEAVVVGEAKEGNINDRVEVCGIGTS